MTITINTIALLLPFLYCNTASLLLDKSYFKLISVVLFVSGIVILTTALSDKPCSNFSLLP